jgi:GWxTD domain-containing protein
MSKMTLAAAVAYLGFLNFALVAQPPQKQPTDPTTSPRKQTVEKNDALLRWPKEDVSYIITDAELKAYNALKTDDERENFIKDFWDRRDPNPDTAENEFREEYYERIQYANEHFTSGIPGWKTDRGRMYIRWGKPDEIESHPSGGSYDEPGYASSGSITTYPFEIWFYRHLDGPGDGTEIEFVDPTGTGEYHIAHDREEKNALGIFIGPRPSPLYEHQQDTALERLRLAEGLETPPSVKFPVLEKIVNTGSGVVDNNPLDFDVRVDCFRQSENSVIAAFTVQAQNKELSFKPSGGISTATINIFGKITAISNKRSGVFEDSVTTNATDAALAQLKAGQSAYQKLIALPPGIYKVDVVVRDIATGNTGMRTLGFTVPRYDPAKLSTSTLVLASTLRQTNNGDIGGLFVIGNHKVMPNVSSVYKKGQDVGIYLQVYNAGTDQTTLKPDIDVDYILLRDGKEVSRTHEDWSGLSDLSQRLVLAKLFPTSSLAPGEYEIIVSIRDRVSPQKIENTAKFTIIQ